MVKVISVKFRGNCRSYYFDPGEYEIQTGDGVIVETARGEEYGDVVEGVKELEESLVPAALKPIIRIATEEDTRLRKEYISKESDAFMLCQERITDHKLDMKLVDVEYSYNGSKIVFYFTADERVDFRDLVKDLAYALRTRIELRQIGVRDEAKMLGGLGPCGRPVCCNAFLDDFRPVSIKMAKEQSLSLSPTKISGLCGRLMCCLQYEQYAYEEAHKRLPRVGKELETPEGVGIVTECNVLTERVKVRLPEDDGSFEVKEFACTEVGPGTLGKKAKPVPAPEAEETSPSSEAAPADDQPAEKAEERPVEAPAAEKLVQTGEQREKRSRRDRSRHDRGGSEKAGTEHKDVPAGENGKKQETTAQGEKNGERPHAENGGAASERRESGRRHGRRGGKPAGEGTDKPQDKRRDKPQDKRDGKPKEPRPDKPREPRFDKPASGPKPEITRLPGETIGMNKQEQSAEAPKPAASSHRSNLHRKHSFGPRN